MWHLPLSLSCPLVWLNIIRMEEMEEEEEGGGDFSDVAHSGWVYPSLRLRLSLSLSLGVSHTPSIPSWMCQGRRRGVFLLFNSIRHTLDGREGRDGEFELQTTTMGIDLLSFPKRISSPPFFCNKNLHVLFQSFLHLAQRDMPPSPSPSPSSKLAPHGEGRTAHPKAAKHNQKNSFFQHPPPPTRNVTFSSLPPPIDTTYLSRIIHFASKRKGSSY